MSLRVGRSKNASPKLRFKEKENCDSAAWIEHLDKSSIMDSINITNISKFQIFPIENGQELDGVDKIINIYISEDDEQIFRENKEGMQSFISYSYRLKNDNDFPDPTEVLSLYLGVEVTEDHFLMKFMLKNKDVGIRIFIIRDAFLSYISNMECGDYLIRRTKNYSIKSLTEESAWLLKALIESGFIVASPFLFNFCESSQDKLLEYLRHIKVCKTPSHFYYSSIFSKCYVKGTSNINISINVNEISQPNEYETTNLMAPLQPRKQSLFSKLLKS